MRQFRAADITDASFLVPLVSVSSGGVWPALWRVFANDGESVEKSGTRYLADTSNDLSIKNAVIAMLKDQPIGAMISYQEQSKASTTGDSRVPQDLNDALQPYRELTDPDSLFISELCLLPESRGQGVGSLFLDHAKQLAAKSGLPKVSLRVFSSNVGAVRLYTRSGFDITGERPVIAHPDIDISGSVFLMTHTL